MKPGERPPASPPNSGQPTRPHMWGATPCIEARACHKVRPTQRLGGQPKKRLDDCLRLDLCQNMKMPARRFPPPWSIEKRARSIPDLGERSEEQYRTSASSGSATLGDDFDALALYGRTQTSAHRSHQARSRTRPSDATQEPEPRRVARARRIVALTAIGLST